MKKIKTKVCSCGEDVFENDYGDKPSDGFLYCVNCGKPHRPDSLIEEEVPDIKETPPTPPKKIEWEISFDKEFPFEIYGLIMDNEHGAKLFHKKDNLIKHFIRELANKMYNEGYEDAVRGLHKGK